MAPREVSPGVVDLTDPNLRPVRPERPQVSRAPDGDRIAADASEHVRFLSRVSGEVGIADPVGERFAAVLGHGDELHEAAERWRCTAEALERAAGDVGGKLGGIDAAWEGADADAFLAHMQEVGLAGNDVVDAMRGLADALDYTAEALGVLAQEFADVVREAADSVSAALVVPFDGESRVRQHLQELDDPARELFEAAEDVVKAFVEFCDDVDAGRGIGDGERRRREMPEIPAEKDSPEPAAPEAQGGSAASAGGAPAAGGAAGASSADAGGGAVPGGAAPSQLAEGGTSRAQEPSETPAAGAGSGTSAAPAAAAAGGATTGGGMMGMMPMGGMMGQNQQNQQRQNSSRIKASPEELFGKPEQAAPAVFGASPKKPGNPDSGT